MSTKIWVLIRSRFKTFNRAQSQGEMGVSTAGMHPEGNSKVIKRVLCYFSPKHRIGEEGVIVWVLNNEIGRIEFTQTVVKIKVFF